MSLIRSACPNCGDVTMRRTYDIGSGPELSCAECEWCWGADGQELHPVPMPDGLPDWAYPTSDPRSPHHDDVEPVIEASSLGTPEAKALRDSTPPGAARAMAHAADCLRRAEDAEAKLAELRITHHDFVGAAGSKMGGLYAELHAALDALRLVVLLTEPAGGAESEALVLVDGRRVAEVARGALAPAPAQPDFALPADVRRRLADMIGPALLGADDVVGALGVTRAEAAVMFVCGHYLGHLLDQGLIVSPESGARPAVDPQAERVLAGAAHYFSTYCLHDRHDECRVTCKFCPAPCRCSCHGGADG